MKYKNVLFLGKKKGKETKKEAQGFPPGKGFLKPG
jgi:hypothetical protein